jgi:hypothetical protein
VSLETAGGYDLAWKRWCIFMFLYTNTIPRAGIPQSTYLLNGCSKIMRKRLVCEFGQYLFAEIKLMPDRVSQQISALRFCVLDRGGKIEGFDSPQLTALRKGLSNQPLPPGWESRSRLPTTLDMAIDVHTVCKDSTDLETKAVSVAMVLAYCVLLRPSEYCTHTKHDRHVLRASSVEFECLTCDGRTRFLGSHLLVSEGITWEMVKLVKISFLSAKNISDRVGRVIWFTAHRPNNALQLPKVLFE